MKILACALMLALAACTGCHHRKASVDASASNGRKKVVVAPDRGLTGRVVRNNQIGRFVVLNFPIGRLPALDQRFGVYRNGLKIGEVKIVGPQYDDNIVADLVDGDAIAGDEVREN